MMGWIKYSLLWARAHGRRWTVNVSATVPNRGSFASPLGAALISTVARVCRLPFRLLTFASASRVLPLCHTSLTRQPCRRVARPTRARPSWFRVPGLLYSFLSHRIHSRSHPPLLRVRPASFPDPTLVTCPHALPSCVFSSCRPSLFLLPLVCHLLALPCCPFISHPTVPWPDSAAVSDCLFPILPQP